MRFLAILLVLFASPALADPPSVHGMLVIGTQSIYLSHLPMFHTPHDYQGIFEAELPPQVLDLYRRDRVAFPNEGVYTLVPQAFDLPGMVRAPRPFVATLFRGHFERGGRPIAPNFQVNLKRVLLFTRLVPATPRPPIQEYFIFGDAAGPEFFAAHRIVSQPDFDHVIIARSPMGSPIRAALAAATTGLTPITLRGVPQTQPAKSATKVPVLAAGGRPDIIEFGRELYLERGDLSH